MINTKGVTIEIAADTSKFDKKIRDINREVSKTDRELKKLNNALKFNPTSVDLWRQKQQVLTQRIDETSKKLQQLKEKQKAMDAAGVDKNSEEYRKLQREIIETESKLKHFKSELMKLGNVSLKALGEQFKQVGKKMENAGRTLTMKVTAPLAAVGAVGVKTFAEVDKTMQLTNSTMGNTAEQAELLDKAMRDAAANSTYSMNDASQATLNFARAGLTAEQAASALAPAMNLAAGEGGNLDTVSAGLVATINGFHGSFDEAAKYADIFANACNNSALDVDSLSSAMSVAAPIFSAAGYEVQDAALYMGVMANNGIEADKAANSLKTGLARLVSPASEGAKMMEKLGISVTNADGTMKDSVQIQKELNQAFSQLSESEQIAAASAIFGKNQMAPWLALINTAPEDVNKLNQSLMETGTAMKMSEAMMSGFGGSLEKIKSSLNVAAYSLGKALAPAVSKVADLIQRLADWFNNLSPKTQQLIATIGLIVAAIGPVLLIGGKIIGLIGGLFTGISTLIGVIKSVGTVVGLLASSGLLPIIAIIGAVIAIGVLLYKNWDTIKAKAIAFKDAVITAFNNLKNNITNTFNAIKNAIVTPIQNAIDTVKRIIDKVKGFFPISIGRIFSNLKLPHFKLTGEFSLKNKTVPHLSVDWYKTGGIFDSPSIIGVGEAGAEAVVPIDTLWKKLDAIAEASSGNAIVVNVYGSDNMSVNELAEAVEQRLIQMQKRRTMAWQ